MNYYFESTRCKLSLKAPQASQARKARKGRKASKGTKAPTKRLWPGTCLHTPTAYRTLVTDEPCLLTLSISLCDF